MVMEEQYMYLEYATCAFQTQVLWAQWKSDVSSFPMYILKFIATNKGDESDVMKLYSPDVRYYPGSNFITEAHAKCASAVLAECRAARPHCVPPMARRDRARRARRRQRRVAIARDAQAA